MKATAGKFLLVALLVFTTEPSPGQSKPDAQWFLSLQTGFADTFQLTLGGMFGNGPGWQNRITTGINNAFRGGDSFSVYGWDTTDTRIHTNEWQAGFMYKAPVWKRGKQSLVLGTGLQHWRFPDVKAGAHDYLIPGLLVYQAPLPKKMTFLTTSESWTIVSSPMQRGSLLHTQSWVQYPLLKREWVQVAFKTGPAHTYSWDFWGTHGNRIIRYQSMLTLTFRKFTLEGGYRKQFGLQQGIADNKFWQVAVTRTFTKPL